jgi:hypothetical protein
VIEARGLGKRFGETTALGGVSFKVEKGEVAGFLGLNGAGKTTTLRILATYLTPDSGSALVAGCDPVDDPIGVRRRLGYLPEHPPLDFAAICVGSSDAGAGGPSMPPWRAAALATSVGDESATSRRDTDSASASRRPWCTSPTS